MVDGIRDLIIPRLDVCILLLDVPTTKKEVGSYLGVEVSFSLFFATFDLVGIIEQVIKIPKRIIETETDVTKDELSEILEPLFQEIDSFAQGIQRQMSKNLDGEIHEI